MEKAYSSIRTGFAWTGLITGLYGGRVAAAPGVASSGMLY